MESNDFIVHLSSINFKESYSSIGNLKILFFTIRYRSKSIELCNKLGGYSVLTTLSINFYRCPLKIYVIHRRISFSKKFFIVNQFVVLNNP